MHQDIQPKVRSIATILTDRMDGSLEDDERRYQEILDILDKYDLMYQPHAIGLQAHRCVTGQSHNANKAAIVYGGILFWARNQGIFVKTFKQGEFSKRFFCDSEEAIREKLGLLIEGVQNKLRRSQYPRLELKASCQAHLILDELMKIRENSKF